MNLRRPLFSSFILLLAATGCTSSLVPGRAQDQSATIDELKRRVLDLQRQATMHEEEIARLRERLSKLEHRPAPVPAQPAGHPVPGDRDVALPPPSPAPVIAERDLEAISYPPSRPPLPDRSTEAAQADTGATPSTVPEPAQRLYDQGYTLYHQGRYAEAEADFRRFLQAWGTTDLADNAQYWIGESRYARKDFAGALAAFGETVERYPAGNKVPDAMLKAGQCFEAVADLSSALETYQEVVDRFPGSPAALRATARLDALR